MLDRAKGAPKNGTPDITSEDNKKGEPHFAFGSPSLVTDLAERTGLEPATPGVTGRYSDQLNYRSVRLHLKPALRVHVARACEMRKLVGAERLELPTYAL
jgi:hypothetical protein